MRKRDLFRMSIGTYEITDSHGLYKYIMDIGLNEDGSRFYCIEQKDSYSRERIFMSEDLVRDEDYGYHYKILSAMSGVGGIRIHTDDTFFMLNDLHFVPRGSFQKFVDITTSYDVKILKTNAKTPSEYFIGTSDNVDVNLRLSDIMNSDTYLYDKESIGKFYEVFEIYDYDKLQAMNKGRCTYCHANIDKTCAIKMVKCLCATKQCYRRKYCL